MAGSIIAWQISKYTGAHLVKVTGLLRSKSKYPKRRKKGWFIARRDGMYATDGKGKVLWCQGLLWGSGWVPCGQLKLSFIGAHCPLSLHCPWQLSSECMVTKDAAPFLKTLVLLLPTCATLDKSLKLLRKYYFFFKMEMKYFFIGLFKNLNQIASLNGG